MQLLNQSASRLVRDTRGLVMRHYRSAALLVSLAALSVIIPAAQGHPPAGAGAAQVAPFTSGGGVSAQQVAIASSTPSYTGEPVPACRLLGTRKVLFAQA